MRERAKTFGVRLEVWSQEGAGTEVDLTISASIAYRLSSAPFNPGRSERGVISVSNKPKPIQLLVVDDHPLLREGIAAIIINQTDIELVGEASNGREAIEKFRSHRSDVLTTYSGDVLAQRALKAGAQAYMLKSDVRKDLPDTIRSVHAGKGASIPKSPPNSLTTSSTML